MPRDPASRIDLWTGLGASLASLILMAAVIPAWVPVFSPPRPVALAPWMLPQAAAAILGLAGATLAWRGRRGGAAPEPTVWRGLLLAVAGVAGYVAAMPLLGGVGAGAALTAALVLWRKGWRAWPAALATAAAATGLAWAMFVGLAGTPLPRGPWGF
jgi:hypothetical protein